MFEHAPGPRVFGLQPGADFPAALVEGLVSRAKELPSERFARVTVYVNTTRMRRRIVALFDAGPPRILPRIRLVTEIGRELAIPGLPPPVPPLRRRLALTRLVAALIQADPGVAPRAATFDLADSLAALIDEMQGEGVSFAALDALDMGGLSGHWERNRRFLSLIGDYLAAGAAAPDPEARQRLAIERLAARWQEAPPDDPVIVAGSTGSRGSTLMLMEAVARLPQGAVILPGFDTDLPGDIWARLADDARAEDHPQYRFTRLFERLGIGPGDVRGWAGAPAPEPARNRLVSLAMRPAPVTNQWLRDGPALGDLVAATAGLSLVEAPGPRDEARAIAWLLRKAVQDGKRVALVTPDRMLTRRVTALLDRWGILPDDSAGRPLALLPPGRLLRQVAGLMAERATLDAVLALLKHPLTHAGAERGDHLRHTRDLELWLRHKAVPWVDRAVLMRWAEKRPEDRRDWGEWLAACLEGAAAPGETALTSLVDRHRTLCEQLVAGSASVDASALWDKPAGRAAAQVMGGLAREAEHGGAMTAPDYVGLFHGILAGEQVREAETPRPDIMIWGTLEARVQGADLVILGGLNDGIWPALPEPDPWLNRRMRAAAGLLLPERRIGLAAHDFQQAIAAPEAVLTRTLRDENAEPVPSRWLNRLTNLLKGLPGTNGPEALDAMKSRGQSILREAGLFDLPDPAQVARPAPRPSPRPPVAARPRVLSFTQVETLIRDPYAIYARHILGLRRLNPLRPEPDALLRGTILHGIFKAFMDDWRDGKAPDPTAHLIAVARREIDAKVEWPLAARLWRARIERIAGRFVTDEVKRQETATFRAAEVDAKLYFPRIDFTLKGRADRIDDMHEGGYAILDYKGTAPTKKQMRSFAVQLLLEALAAEGGGFEGLDAAEVREVVYVGYGADAKRGAALLVDSKDGDFSTASVHANFEGLIAAYDTREKGYTARRAIEDTRYAGDFDHLARHGEWDDTDDPVSENVG